MTEIQEKIFTKNNRGITEIFAEYKGYTCIVFAMNSGHRCGYVVIPETHPLYKNEHIDVECHCGITFNKIFEGEEHVIGFDCAHIGDLPDVSIMNEAHFKMHQMMNQYFNVPEEGATVKTKEFVFENCKGIVDQLIEFEENNE